MARIRTIKPAFFRSITMTELPIAARLTFIGLWTYVDDAGRGVDDTRLIKAELWPLDDAYTLKKVEGDLRILEEKNLIVRYSVLNRHYLAICNWKEHQKINRPQESSLPDHCERTDDSVNDHGTLTDDSLREGKGREGKGKERESGFEGDFEECWHEYPRKKSKGEAKEKYIAQRRKGVSHATLLAAVRNFAAQMAKESREETYIMYGAKFFGHNNHWQDFTEAPPLGWEDLAPPKPKPFDEVYEGELVKLPGE